MAGDFLKSHHIRHLIGYLFGPPGWSHDGSSQITSELRKRQASAEKKR
ncbi:hypothetical protein [Hydrotalea flava]|nr:hypothetical protein [Hydrotalea flava]